MMGWLAFWFTFFVLGHLFPYTTLNESETNRKTSKTRPTNDLYVVLMKNAFASFLFTSLVSLLFNTTTNHNMPQTSYCHSLFSFCTRICISLVLLETCFYYSHRLFHHKWFWRFHQTHHKYTSPIALSAVYCSVPEMIVVNQLPVMIGPILTGMKTWEIVIWMMIAAISMCSNVVVDLWQSLQIPFFLFSGTLMAHSSVDSVLFGTCKRFKMHDIHHMDYRYNFGFLIFLDWLHGTYKRPVS